MTLIKEMMLKRGYVKDRGFWKGKPELKGSFGKGNKER